MDKANILEIHNLTVEYTSDGQIVHAVNDISLSLEKGKTLALVGETGAGKTTIAKSILRILPDPPAKVKNGSILFNGENLLDLSEKEMRKIRGMKISMVFQDPMTALNPVIKIGDQIAEVIGEHHHMTRSQAKKEAEEMLEMVGITRERYDEYPHQFSGGMKQRVIIAIALACKPMLLLADEPTTALDVTIQAQVLEMIKALKKKQNTSMVLITHDLGVVADMADNVAIIYAGQVLESGTLRQIYKHACHPYTIGLFHAIPDIKGSAKRLHNIQGLPPDPTNLPVGCCFHPRCPYATEDCRKNAIPLREIEEGHYLRCIYDIEQKGGHQDERQSD